MTKDIVKPPQLPHFKLNPTRRKIIQNEQLLYAFNNRFRKELGKDLESVEVIRHLTDSSNHFGSWYEEWKLINQKETKKFNSWSSAGATPNYWKERIIAREKVRHTKAESKMTYLEACAKVEREKLVDNTDEAMAIYVKICMEAERELKEWESAHPLSSLPMTGKLI